MNTKDNILDNLSEYSPRQLAEYVDKGVITWDDMRDTGDLTPSLRKAIEEQISRKRLRIYTLHNSKKQ